MFRDMSGLQATIGLVQAGIEGAMAGASAAGQQAGENMNNLLKATTERQRIGAEMVTSLARTAASAYTGGAIPAGGGISGASGGGSGSSQQGAKINYFDKTAKPALFRQPGRPGVAVGGHQVAVGHGGRPRRPDRDHHLHPAQRTAPSARGAASVADLGFRRRPLAHRAAAL
jgi:hypothetical protein